MSDNHDGKRSKIDALREGGALNPAPEKLRDPKFHDSEFFDPNDIVQVRYEMLRRVSFDKASVTQVADEYGVSQANLLSSEGELRHGRDCRTGAGEARTARSPQDRRRRSGFLASAPASRRAGSRPGAGEARPPRTGYRSPSQNDRTSAKKNQQVKHRRRVGGFLHGHGGEVRSAARRRLRRRTFAGGSKRPHALSASGHVGMGAGPDIRAKQFSRAGFAAIGGLAVYA